MQAKSGIVLAGNGTLAAAQALGWTEIAAVSVSLGGAAARAYAVADNRTAELATWDEAALAQLLREVGAEDPMLAAATGFSEAEIAALLADAEASDDVSDPGPGSVPTSPSSAAGALYTLGPHRLLCGDSLDARARAQLLAGVSPAPGIAILDPPYEMADHLWTPLIADPSIVFGQARQIRAIPGDLWRFERVIDKVTAHRSATVQVAHRHAFVAQVGSVKTLPRDKKATFDSVVVNAERPEHPHEKPVELLVEHLTAWTPPWKVLVDWFAGSGPALIAAARLGRRALLCEKDPAYCDVIRARWGAFARARGEREIGDAL